MSQLKAYIQLDDLSEAEIPTFQALTSAYFVEYVLINIRNGKRLYIGLIRDSETIQAFLKSIGSKNPIVLGVFGHDGIQWGKTVNVTPATYGEDGKVSTEESKTILGEANHPFQEKEYLELMPDQVTYNAEGEVLTTERPIEVKDLKNFGGWSDCIF